MRKCFLLVLALAAGCSPVTVEEVGLAHNLLVEHHVKLEKRVKALEEVGNGKGKEAAKKAS